MECQAGLSECGLVWKAMGNSYCCQQEQREAGSQGHLLRGQDKGPAEPTQKPDQWKAGETGEKGMDMSSKEG